MYDLTVGNKNIRILDFHIGISYTKLSGPNYLAKHMKGH